MSSLLRSTKFVRYFTGAARTLILNSAKTAESNLLVNTKALCTSNDVVLRNYATTKKAETLEPLLQRLDSEVRRFGRITKKDIDEVFDELRTKSDITSTQSLLVIRCCGELVPEELPEQRTLLVQKIWGVLTERGVPMDISHYNALLRVYIENEHTFSPAKFLEELENKGLQPNRVTYQRLVWRYCQEGDVEGATKVLEKMRELNMPVSEPVLNALVMGHAFHGDTEGARAVLETMASAGLEPTNKTYTLLACGYAKQGDIEGIENIIKTANEKDAYITDKDILHVIESLAVGGHGDKVDKLFSYLHKGVGYNQDVCNLILRLLNKGHEDTAKKILKTMPKSTNIEDSPFKGAFFIRQLLRLNKSPEAIIKTCRELKEEGLIPNALYIATEGALQQGHVELAQNLFKEMEKDGFEIRRHYYWPLLAQKGKEGDEEGLLQLLRDMSAAKVPPNGETLRDYVIPYLIGKDTPQNIILKLQIYNVPVVHGSRNLMIQLLELGEIKKAADIALQYRPRGQFSLISRPIVNALNKTKDIDSFVTILHVISSNANVSQIEDTLSNEDGQEDKTSSNEIGRIVKSAIINLSKPDLCEKLLLALHSKGLRINTESAEAIEQYLGQNMTTKLSEILSQLTSADLELASIENTIHNSKRNYTHRTAAQLELLLAQIKSKGGNNVNRLQKQLLNAYMKENNIDKLNSYIKELESSNFDFNAITLAQLYEFYCLNDNIEKANECRAKLHAKDPEFVLNKYKQVLMAYALVRANKFDEAIQFLKDNKPTSGEDNFGFMYNSKCWQLLNNLAEKKDEVKVKEMTNTLIENNYIEPSNVILGPSIKVHILKEDLEGALKQFEICCKQYRSTPWKGELMKALILKEDATKLQWLADLSTQIHGEVNTLHDLVLAFIECGRLRQARRILETPGMQTRQRRLEDACLRYVEEGKSEYLEGLLEATKELSHIERSTIFYHLLVTYCKANETDKALGLWTLLQEEGEIPSEQFLVYLGKHLKAQNREVPFVIPEDQKSVKPAMKANVNKVIVKEEELKLNKKEMSATIENLIKSQKVSEAVDYTVKTLKSGVIPKSNIFKFLLKTLADTGDVEKIQLLGSYITDAKKRRVTYDDKLTLAIFNKGAGAEYVNECYEAVETANTEEELVSALRKFPRSNALALVMNNEELVQKCHHVAEIAASKGLQIPANLLWMEYILTGKEKEADSLWKQWLSDSSSLLFRRLLQESYVRNEPRIIEKLIEALKSNINISKGSLGNAYSRLINIHLLNNKPEEAKATFNAALASGVTTDQFNRNCLKRLQYVLDATGVQN